MKDGFLKAAAAAPKIRVADPAWNALEICKALDSCYAQRAKLIVLPELCLTGYTCQDLFLQERLLEESLEGLQTVLERILDDISFSAPDRSGEAITVDGAAVRAALGDLAHNTDLSRFIL